MVIVLCNPSSPCLLSMCEASLAPFNTCTSKQMFDEQNTEKILGRNCKVNAFNPSIDNAHTFLYLSGSQSSWALGNSLLLSRTDRDLMPNFKS